MGSKPFLAILVGIILSQSICLCEVQYTIQDIGTYKGNQSTAFAINNEGQVIGEARFGEHIRYCFIWSDGVFREIEGLTGDFPILRDLNDSGQVVGYDGVEDGYAHGFVWDDGEVTDIGYISGNFSRAIGINAHGQVTGWTKIANPPDSRGKTRAFLWDDGTMVSLGTLGGWVSYGYSINDVGQITGYSYISTGEAHGFIWENGVMRDIAPNTRILGTDLDINNAGHIIGTLKDSGQPFLWKNEAIIALGTLGGQSYAKAINEKDQVVGESNSRAFLWKNRQMLDLNDLIDPGSGWSRLTTAYGINDLGQIVGEGTIDGYRHAFLLTPIPEPNNIADMNFDGIVNLEDYAIFVNYWNAGRPYTIPRGSVVVDGDLAEWTSNVHWIVLDKIYNGEPNDISLAKAAFCWNADTHKIYTAVVVEDTNHIFTDDYISWDASDRIEIYTQGDAAGGIGWYGKYDAAQHYMTGANTAGGAWATWALGQEIDPNAAFEYAVRVDGDQIIYEIGITQFDNYGGITGGDTVLTELYPGHQVGLDIVASTRWSGGFGMLAENLMTGKYLDADQFARYTLVEGVPQIPCLELRSDLNRNCLSDLPDIRIFTQNWLQSTGGN